MARIKVANPVVDLEGDEMTRVLWAGVKERFILPWLDIDLKTYDLSIQNRDATDDRVTLEAAHAIQRHHVGIACPTVSADETRVRELGLKKMWKTPNGTIRHILGGTIFRAPILCRNIPRRVPGWTKPVVVARHAHGDQYRAADVRIPGAGRLTLRFEPAGNSLPQEWEVHRFEGPGIGLGMFNTDRSIEEFAQAVFHYGLDNGLPTVLSTKDTILKSYDGRFRDIFAGTYEREFRAAYEAAGLTYEHRLIDEMVAWVLRSEGGILWACKNYDGDVQSDAVAQAFGSPGLMSSVLLCPDGMTMEAEVAHGTITRHWREHRQGRPTSTNPIATIHAWTRGLAHRGRLDGTPEVVQFARTLEKVCVDTVESGKMTRDLAAAVAGTPDPPREMWQETDEYLDTLAANLEQAL